MFTVKYNGEMYKVEFGHAKRDAVVKKTRKRQSVTEPRWTTTCLIGKVVVHKKNPELALIEWVGRGDAVCHPSEQFNRARGRKKAFARAVWAMAPDRTVACQDPEDGIWYRQADPGVIEMRHAFWYHFGLREGWPWVEREDACKNDVEKVV